MLAEIRRERIKQQAWWGNAHDDEHDGNAADLVTGMRTWEVVAVGVGESGRRWWADVIDTEGDNHA